MITCHKNILSSSLWVGLKWIKVTIFTFLTFTFLQHQSFSFYFCCNSFCQFLRVYLFTNIYVVTYFVLITHQSTANAYFLSSQVARWLFINRDSSPLSRSIEPFHQLFSTAAHPPILQIVIVLSSSSTLSADNHSTVLIWPLCSMAGFEDIGLVTIWQKQLCPRSSSSDQRRRDPSLP